MWSFLFILQKGSRRNQKILCHSSIVKHNKILFVEKCMVCRWMSVGGANSLQSRDWRWGFRRGECFGCGPLEMGRCGREGSRRKVTFPLVCILGHAVGAAKSVRGLGARVEWQVMEKVEPFRDYQIIVEKGKWCFVWVFILYRLVCQSTSSHSLFWNQTYKVAVGIYKAGRSICFWEKAY